MHHDTPLLTTLVLGLGLAYLFGMLAHRCKMPPLVGYLVAGIVVGPFTPGLMANQELATELAEIGVILLMFGVGLHFSIKDLLSVKKIAIPGAIVQIAIATLMGMGLAHLMGWPWGQGLVFGLALSVASTVVLLKALQKHEPYANRWDFAIGFQHSDHKDEYVYWVEIHTASDKEIKVVVKKLEWLKAWLKGEGRELAKFDREFLWVSSGSTLFTRSAPQRKQLAALGLRYCGNVFHIQIS